MFLTYARNDEKAQRFARAQSCFREAAKLHEPKIEQISVRCSNDYWGHNVPYMLDWLEERL